MTGDCEQEVRTQATVRLTSGENLKTDHVELSPGWVHIRNRESTKSWTVRDIPARRVQKVVSTEYDNE